jgi:hypothetical protein
VVTDRCQNETVGIDRAVLFRLATNERLERAAKAVPGGERAAWRAASHYVAGCSQDEALTTAAALLDGGHGVSVDLFGELVADVDAASDYCRSSPEARTPQGMRRCRTLRESLTTGVPMTVGVINPGRHVVPRSEHAGLGRGR